MDRGAWWATVHGVVKSQTQLCYWAHTHICILILKGTLEGFAQVLRPGKFSYFSLYLKRMLQNTAELKLVMSLSDPNANSPSSVRKYKASWNHARSIPDLASSRIHFGSQKSYYWFLVKWVKKTSLLLFFLLNTNYLVDSSATLRQCITMVSPAGLQQLCPWIGTASVNGNSYKGYLRLQR